MDMTIDQQVALDETLVPHASRLSIRKSNFHLKSDISSKESTLQLVYDVLRLTLFFKAFLVTADVLEIYMQEFWATAMVHHHSIRFKMDNKKHIVNLEYFREMLHICPRLPGIRLSTSAKGKQPAKASKAKSLTALFEVAMTEVEQLKLATKRSLQQTHISQASGLGADERTGTIPRVPDVPTKESDEEISWKSNEENKDDDDQDEGDDDDNQKEGSDDDQASDEEGEEFIHPNLSIHDEEETRDDESFDPIPKMPENTNDEGNGEENLGLNVNREEGQDEEDDEDELYRDVNINLEGRGVKMADVYTTHEFEDSHVILTLVNPDGQQQSSSVSSQFMTSMLNPTPDAGIESIFETTSQMDVQVPTTVAPLPLSAPTLTPSTFATTTIFAGAVSSILGIIQRYMDQRINKAVKVAVQIQSDRLRDESQADNEEFLKNLDVNIQKIIKEQVKEQVKVQVSKILPRIKQTVNEQLEAEVLTWSSNSSKTSYAVAADLSEMELKKILIEKMEGNKSIHLSNEQRNLYKALVEAYESDKIILDTYGDTVTLKRRRNDDAYKDEEPSTGSDRGSKRRREGKEPESASALKKKATRSAGKTTQGSKSRQTSVSESATVEEPIQTTHEMKESSHLEFKTESACDVYSKRRTIDVTELKIVKWYNYKHLDWITVRKDDDKLYKFKEGDFKRLHIQDIEDMLLLLVQGNLTNLTVKERFAFNVSLRMFTRSIVIQRCVEDLQLGVESYQKKLNLTRPDTFCSDLKHKEAYIAYSNPRGFIYQNKDKQNRLMWIDELPKFSDGTLTDVRTTLDDLLKGIRMKYLP
nr:hypothetical protein [Tanacetum cinerariifolium]